MEEKKINMGLVVLICLLFLVIIIMGAYILLDKENENNQVNNDGDTNIVDKGNISDNVTPEYKTYNVGDVITLKDGSKWQVIKYSGNTDDYVTVLGEEDYVDYLQGDEYEAVRDQMYTNFVEYKGSALDKFMQSQQSRIHADLKEVDGYKIRLITLDEIFALDNNWVKSEQGGYKYTKSTWSDSIPMGITTMTLVSDKDRAYGKQWAYYTAIQTTCYTTDCTENYFISSYNSGLGGYYPVANIYKNSI